MNQYGDIGDIVGPGLGVDGDLSEANGERRIASVDIAEGDPLRIDVNGMWALCDINSYTNATAVAIATETGSASSDVLGIYVGKVDITNLPFTNSEALFISDTGKITNVATTIINTYVTCLGKGLYNGSMYVQCEEPTKVVS